MYVHTSAYRSTPCTHLPYTVPITFGLATVAAMLHTAFHDLSFEQLSGRLQYIFELQDERAGAPVHPGMPPKRTMGISVG
jgi:hypothetical protein